MDWAVAQTITCTHIASIPGDTPFIPYDLISRLSEALKNQPESEIACARSSNRLHPVIALWPLTQREPLRRALTEDGIRKVDDWLSRFHTSIVDWPISEPDPFFNINTLEDLRGAERLFGGLEE
jgi:molybdopterin-guanine dinucleotide biosynthesis protein A